MSGTSQLPSRYLATRLLDSVQILYQNKDIDAEMKKEIVTKIKAAMNTSDFSDVNQYFRKLSYFSLMPKVVDDCIRLTN